MSHVIVHLQYSLRKCVYVFTAWEVPYRTVPYRTVPYPHLCLLKYIHTLACKRLRSNVSTLQCTVYTILLYTVVCTLYSVQYTVYSVHTTVYSRAYYKIHQHRRTPMFYSYWLGKQFRPLSVLVGWSIVWSNQRTWSWLKSVPTSRPYRQHSGWKLVRHNYTISRYRLVVDTSN